MAEKRTTLELFLLTILYMSLLPFRVICEGNDFDPAKQDAPSEKALGAFLIFCVSWLILGMSLATYKIVEYVI